MGSIGANKTTPSVLADSHTLGDYIRTERSKRQREAGYDWRKRWKDSKMYKYDIDGKEVATNYGSDNYPYWNGNGGGRYLTVGLYQTSEDVLKSLIEQGYKKIRFMQSSTRIRGYTHLHAFYS